MTIVCILLSLSGCSGAKATNLAKLLL